MMRIADATPMMYGPHLEHDEHQRAPGSPECWSWHALLGEMTSESGTKHATNTYEACTLFAQLNSMRCAKPDDTLGNSEDMNCKDSLLDISVVPKQHAYDLVSLLHVGVCFPLLLTSHLCAARAEHQDLQRLGQHQGNCPTSSRRRPTPPERLPIIWVFRASSVDLLQYSFSY